MSSFNFGKLIPGPLVVLALLWLFVFRRKSRSHWGHRNVPWGERGFEQAQRTVERAQRHAERHIQRHGHHGSQWAQQAAQWSAANRTPTAQPSAQPGPGPQTPPVDQPSAAAQRPQDRVTEPVQPVWTEDDPLGLYVDEPPAGAIAAPRPPAAPPVKGYRGVKPVVVLLSAAAIAIAWLSGAPTTTMLAIGLATLGMGMLLGGFLGKTVGLLPLGILLALGVAASTVFPHVPRDIASVDFVATPNDSIDATSTTYRFDAGSVKLDLTKAVFKPGAKVFVEGGAGEVVVKLPPNVDVTGNLTADTGQVDAFGKTNGGHSAKMAVTDLGADGKAGPQTVALDLHLKLGSIRVER
jgi:hypothetical protein